MRVPMRSTGADQLVVAMKDGNASGAKGLDHPALLFWSTRNGRSQRVRQRCWRRQQDDKSRMTGDCHVRICEGLGVKFPRATRLLKR